MIGPARRYRNTNRSSSIEDVGTAQDQERRLPVDPQIQTLLDRVAGVPATHTLPLAAARTQAESRVALMGQHFPSLGARARARVEAGIQRPWPADKVERWGIDRLIPYAKNARTHTDPQVAAIAASIKEWGWTTPALVGEDGGLIAGHARVLAARQLGIANIPVMVAAGWSEAQKRAYVLADNQLAITGSGWDPELLRLELGELKLSGFDLSLTGFADFELKDIMADRTGGRAGPERR